MSAKMDVDNCSKKRWSNLLITFQKLQKLFLESSSASQHYIFQAIRKEIDLFFRVSYQQEISTARVDTL